MRRFGEVWYFERSMAAPLTRLLRRRYAIRALPRPTRGHPTPSPQSKEIREIPRIARAHHEKLNGTGYPYRLKSDEIPVQAKIMTICDMFDALSASDRPYKRAVAPERALNILELSVKRNELDPELFGLFLEAKVFNRTDKR
jgi:HD-GYP domain-containing protein (c-di-GMP phosphodiesterase class II)